MSGLPSPKIIGIHGSSFWDLIPTLRLRRHGRVREVTKFHVAIRDNGTLCPAGCYGKRFLARSMGRGHDDAVCPRDGNCKVEDFVLNQLFNRDQRTK